MNSYFTGICQKLNTCPNTEEALSFIPKLLKPDHRLRSFLLTNESEVLHILKSMEPKKSAGWDELSPFLLKKCAHVFVNPLTSIINQSLVEGVFPDLLKISVIKPIPKRKDNHSLDNFRPISLLSTFSKVLEKIVLKRLNDFLQLSRTLSDSQFGFRKGKSTCDAIYTFLEHVTKAVDGSHYTVGVLCDLSKAFDCIDFSILKAKLKFYGIEGLALSWLSSFLTNRKQKVFLDDDAQSGFVDVTSGVPQGSVLGPLLFLIYVNDLPEVIDSAQVIQYVDDTSVVASHCDKILLSKLLDDKLLQLNRWFSANGLILNSDKTQLINFHINNKNSRQNDISYLPQSAKILSSAKFLGVVIDSSLTWREHIAQLLPKLSTAFFSILSLSNVVDLHTLKQVYYAYFQSYISYGVVFWGNSSDSSKIFTMQKRVIRIMTRSAINESCRKHFQELNILPFPSLYIFHCIMFVVSNFDQFCGNNHQHSHFTRNTNLLQYPVHRTSFFENAPLYSCITLFNHLPDSIKQQRLKSTLFRKTLFQYLLSHCFYSRVEFLSVATGRNI